MPHARTAVGQANLAEWPVVVGDWQVQLQLAGEEDGTEWYQQHSDTPVEWVCRERPHCPDLCVPGLA